MRTRSRKLLALGLVVVILAVWIVLLHFVAPQEIVRFLGVENAYGIIFLLAVLTGGSTLTAATLYTVLVALVKGGLPLLGVGIAAGLGGVVGDTIYYYIGNRSHEVLSHKYQHRVEKIKTYLEKHPKLTPLFIFAYAAFIPLPDDLMTISLGLSGYPYKKAIIPLLIGNIVFYTLWLYLVTNAITAFTFLFV